MSEFGKYLKELRGDKSLREMERITGLSHTYLSTLEKGVDPRSGKERKPTPEILKKLSETLDVDYDILMIKAGYSKPKEELEELIKSYIRVTENIKEVSVLIEDLMKRQKTLSSGVNIQRDELNELLFELTNKGVSSELNLFRTGLKDDIRYMNNLEKEIIENIESKSNEIDRIISKLEI